LIKNGALAGLHKPTTAGDVLDKTILRAISTVEKSHKSKTKTKPLPSTITQLELPASATVARL
jgi:hypothetical protein